MTPAAALSLPECMQVTHQLFYFLDESKYHDLVSLVHRKRHLAPPGRNPQGCEQIIQALSKRSTTQRIRHVISNDFSVPFRFTPRNMLDFALHHGWLSDIIRHGMPVMENMLGLETKTSSATVIASSVGRSYDPAFNWEGLQKIRDNWPRRLIVKGILGPADAVRVATRGCDAVVVSNHGGRQLDGAVASFDALPGVVQAVNGRIPVLLDGGVRRGSDIFKALAMGTDGVMIGRATLYGASAAGEAGASRALAILKDELIRTVRLCGRFILVPI